MPTVVEDSLQAPDAVGQRALRPRWGRSCCASAITDAASSGDRSTRPATNSAISASGKIDSSRL